jgi:hypothetical protein
MHQTQPILSPHLVQQVWSTQSHHPTGFLSTVEPKEWEKTTLDYIGNKCEY